MGMVMSVAISWTNSASLAADGFGKRRGGRVGQARRGATGVRSGLLRVGVGLTFCFWYGCPVFRWSEATLPFSFFEVQLFMTFFFLF